MYLGKAAQDPESNAPPPVQNEVSRHVIRNLPEQSELTGKRPSQASGEMGGLRGEGSIPKRRTLGFTALPRTKDLGLPQMRS
jgi:hypothetical protein